MPLSEEDSTVKTITNEQSRHGKMSPTRNLNLSHRSPLMTSHVPNGKSPSRRTFSPTFPCPSPTIDVFSGPSETKLDCQPLSLGGAAMTEDKHNDRDEHIKTLGAPLRSESLRDRRASRRKHQSPSQRQSTEPSAPMPNVTAIVPPALPNSYSVEPVLSSSSDSSSAEKEVSSMATEKHDTQAKANEIPFPLADPRKAHRIAQAMGLIASGPLESFPRPESRQRHRRARDQDPTSSNPMCGRARATGRHLSSPTASSTFSVPASRTIDRLTPDITKRRRRKVSEGGQSSISSSTSRPSQSQPLALLQVIPPDHLFIPSMVSRASFGDDDSLTLQEDSNIRNKQMRENEFRRWKQGRLMPLKGTMEGMSKAIAKEWGLPSALGMILFLVSDMGSAEMSEPDEEGVIRITSEAWRFMLRDAFLATNSQPAEQTMEHLPDDDTTVSPLESISQRSRANPRHFDKGSSATEPITPTTANSFRDRTTISETASPCRNPAVSAPAFGPRSGSPWDARSTTPWSSAILAPKKVMMKVEFDFDGHKAAWYDTWLKRRLDGLSRTLKPTGASHLRSLHLGKDQPPMMVPREDDITLEDQPCQPVVVLNDDSYYSDQESQTLLEEPGDNMYSRLSDDDEPGDPSSPTQSSDQELVDMPPVEETLADDFATLRSSRPNSMSANLGIKDIGSHAVLDGSVPSDRLGKLAEDEELDCGTGTLDDIEEVAIMLAQRMDAINGPSDSQTKAIATPSLGVPPSEKFGLASPITLPSPQAIAEVMRRDPNLSLPQISRQGDEAEGPQEVFGLGMGVDLAMNKRLSSLVMSDQLDKLERGELSDKMTDPQAMVVFRMLTMTVLFVVQQL